MHCCYAKQATDLKFSIHTSLCVIFRKNLFCIFSDIWLTKEEYLPNWKNVVNCLSLTSKLEYLFKIIYFWSSKFVKISKNKNILGVTKEIGG